MNQGGIIEFSSCEKNNLLTEYESEFQLPSQIDESFDPRKASFSPILASLKQNEFFGESSPQSELKPSFEIVEQ